MTAANVADAKGPMAQPPERSVNDAALLISQAQAADAADRQLTIMQALKKYKKAVMWSTLLSTALIMEGYDVVIVRLNVSSLPVPHTSMDNTFTNSLASCDQINGFFGQPQFAEKFGDFNPDTGKHHISAAWQSGLANSALVGQLAGLVINAFATDRYGCRFTYCFFMAWLACAIFIAVFAPSLSVLAFGEAMSGISWGVFQVSKKASLVVITAL